jgi:peptidoglycan hydrolase-like protein with peptidoglycan-binding domain
MVYPPATIKDIQRTLSCPESGEMDEVTVNHIKGLQYAMGMPGTGRIDEQTAQAIQRLRDRYAVRE